MTRHIKTRNTDKSLYSNFLQKADENFAAARKALEEGLYNAAAVSAVHAAISAADAFCVFGLGKRSASENHKDAASLIMDASSQKELNASIAKRFNAVIGIKNIAEYEERLVRQKEADRAIREAGELLGLVRKGLK